MRDPIAILTSDLHLSLSRPICRDDDDWMETQAFYLGQIKQQADKYNAPVICAGDIFDKWNSSAELINFALEHLPDEMICVAGQHDLPLHSWEDRKRSAYWTLVQAEKIHDITEGLCIIPKGQKFVAHGFGWNVDLEPLGEHRDIANHLPHLAVIHRYCWTDGKSYPDAPREGKVSAWKKSLKGYDAAVVGDNHIGFLTKCGECNLLNCGTFIRRKSDEVKRTPRLGFLFPDGSIKTKKLDTSIDKFSLKAEEKKENAIDMKEFLDGLESLGEGALDFKQAVLNHLRDDNVDGLTKKIILEAMEDHE